MSHDATVPGRPRVSVVIPTLNRRERIALLLARLLEDDGDHEIVVVDDGSSDGTADALRETADRDPRVVPVIGRAGGAIAARLTGARQASGDILVLLDDDVMPEPGLVAGHLEHHVGTPDLLVLGYMPTRVPDPLPRGAFATALYAQEYEQSCVRYAADPDSILTSLWMGNLSLPRARFLQAFDEGLMPEFRHRHEDQLLGLVLRDLGLRAVFDRSLLAHHEHTRPLEAFLRDCYENGRGREAVRALYPAVIGRSSEDVYLDGLPAPARTLVAATRNETWRRTALGGLKAGIRGAGAVGARGAELQLARVARKVEQLHGARDHGQQT